MKYVVGIDGGGTKTVCALADVHGHILDLSYAGCSNHQICGIDQTVRVIDGLIKTTLTKHAISREDVSFISMGLAGADIDSDIELLNKSFSPFLPPNKLEIVNDIWATFRTEISDGWGAITICGTGHNCAVLTPDGKRLTVRALQYSLGNYGGGRHITDKALHCAFRSSEHTGAATELEKRLPKHCGVKDMDELAELIYNSGYTAQYDFEIPKLVFDLAESGDEVSRGIVRKMGEEMSEMLAGLITKAGLQNRDIQVVLGGSQLNKPDSALLVEYYRNHLIKTVPSFNIRIAKNEPVLGALFTALASIGVKTDKAFMDKTSSEFAAYKSVMPEI